MIMYVNTFESREVKVGWKILRIYLANWPEKSYSTSELAQAKLSYKQGAGGYLIKVTRKYRGEGFRYRLRGKGRGKFFFAIFFLNIDHDKK